MSFSLPRNPRALAFTGKFRSPLGASAPPAAASLGKARTRKTPTPAPGPSSLLPSPPPGKVEIREAFHTPNAVRRKFESIDEEMPTSSFDRDALDFLAPAPKSAPPKNAKPIFQVRKAAQAESPATVLVPGKKDKPGTQSGRLLMFVMIGLISMMVGYRFVPMILDRYAPPAQAAEPPP